MEIFKESSNFFILPFQMGYIVFSEGVTVYSIFLGNLCQWSAQCNHFNDFIPFIINCYLFPGTAGRASEPDAGLPFQRKGFPGALRYEYTLYFCRKGEGKGYYL